MEQSKGKIIAIRIWLIISTILSVLFIAICIIGGVQSAKRKQQSNEGIDQLDNSIIAYNLNNDINQRGLINPSFKAVSYIDDEFLFVFSSAEFQYQFVNLANYLNTLVNVDDIEAIITWDDGANEILENEFIPNDTWSFTDSLVVFDLVSADSQFGCFQIGSGCDILSFNDITLNVNSSYYDDFKAAIELDIAANSQTVNDGIFETLSDSIVDFIGAISAGITSVVAVFYSDNALTVIGTLSVIVVAVALAYFLFRLIIGLIRMRG